MSTRSSLRQCIRLKRCQLTHNEQQLGAEKLAKQFQTKSIFKNSQRIAAYLPVQGEIDPTPIIKRAWQMGKQVYLPVLNPVTKNKLWFVRYDKQSQMVENRFGIPEPTIVHRQRISPAALDLVLTPLVGFDAKGNRLGMGGGFYDRSFAFLASRTCYCKPRLIGLAYDFQHVSDLRPQTWDIPLDAVTTETRFTLFQK